MGLSGRREKQRIPNDPRNLSWADNAAKFGQAYLSKLGWDPSQGLGADGDGRTSHIKVSQKLDMLGIGAAQVKDPNGIAWKQNKEFEALLKRLNEDVDDSLDKEDEVRMGEDAVSENAKKKRTKDADGKDKKKKKLKDKSTGDPPPVGAPSQEITSVTPCASDKTFTPRHMAHRARYIASKRLSSKSASAISEVLGIAPTSSSASTLPSTPAPTPTQGTLTPLDDNHTLERLTTSTKSVADYFKERLSAKAVGTCSSPPEEVTPRIGMGGASLNSRTFWASFQNTAGSSENHMISAVASVQHPVEASASQQEKHYSAEKKRKRSTESKAAESIGPLHEPDDGEKARGGAKKKRRKEEKGDVQDLEKARKKAERKAAKNARQET